MTDNTLLQGLGWLGFLSRPSVLEQLLVAGLVWVPLLLLRPRIPGLRRAPKTLVFLVGVALSAALSASLGRRFGLLLLMGQILAAYGALRLVEQ